MRTFLCEIHKDRSPAERVGQAAQFEGAAAGAVEVGVEQTQAYAAESGFFLTSPSKSPWLSKCGTDPALFFLWRFTVQH